ncbi:hypothetical protein C0995_013680, partial [Termitomyces sp. Mi166
GVDESESGDEDNNEEQNKDKDVVRVSSNKDNKDEEYYNIKIKKDTLDKAVEKVKEVTVTTITDTAPYLGVGAAAGKAAA